MNHPIRTSLVLPLAVVAALAGACSDETSSSSPTTAPSSTPAPRSSEREIVPVVDPGDGGSYDPTIDPDAFVDGIDNPYLPFPEGAAWEYEGTSDGETERVVVEVTGETKVVMGITATVVRDRVYVDDELVEDTFDWFAQDRDGNVWYLGEDVKDYENGEVVSTDGSWEAGVDGAIPGIVMPATPAVGDAYRQEFLVGEAEDMFEILATDDSRAVVAGDYSELVVTEDWNPLDPDVIEEKSYAPGVGLVFEEHTRGGEGSIELISFDRG